MRLSEDEWADLKEKGKRARKLRADVEEKRKVAIDRGWKRDVALYESAWRRWQRLKTN